MEEEKIFSLMYADDIVLFTEDEGNMKNMLRRLEGYLDKKRLEVNAEKTKVMRFLESKGKDEQGKIVLERKGIKRSKGA